jgi:hypothetical protein
MACLGGAGEDAGMMSNEEAVNNLGISVSRRFWVVSPLGGDPPTLLLNANLLLFRRGLFTKSCFRGLLHAHCGATHCCSYSFCCSCFLLRRIRGLVTSRGNSMLLSCQTKIGPITSQRYRDQKQQSLIKATIIIIVQA